MDVKEILIDHNIEPKRIWDQYFLIDKEIIEYEIGLAKLEKDDVVLEIGAGIGNVTEKIAEKSHVIAVERDSRFIPILEKLDNVEVIHNNALRVIKELKFNKVVSNIPYAISQKLIIELLKRKWELAVLVVQNEFAKKLKKDKLSAILSDCAEVKIIGNVPSSAFYPRGISSAIVVLKQKALLDEKFWYFLNKAFQNRNRNVKNVFPKCTETMAKRKIHQLTLEELKTIYTNFNN